VTRGLILDLDDTLYLERDFVRSGFLAVAEEASTTGVDASEIFEFLWAGFIQGGRGDAFDRLAVRWPEIGQRVGVASLVRTYRVHQPLIEMSDPGFPQMARDHIAVLGLITDGTVSTQMNKLRALGLENTFDVRVITGAWGPGFYKPNHRAFESVESSLGLAGPRLIYVADNPAKDFVAPNERGWESVRIRRQGQLHENAEPDGSHAAPRHEVRSLSEVLEIL